MQTTLFMDYQVLLQISRFSEISGLSKSFIVKKLLLNLDHVYNYTPTLASLIKYQRHEPEEGFKVFHFRLTRLEKDRFEQMRVKYKSSISLLFLAGFLLFFSKLYKKYLYKTEKSNRQNFVDSYTQLANSRIEKLNNFWMVTGEDKKKAG
ncbi:MAG: hypothetical protein JW982_15330 [Spirochaetes bacterium]|nr:hypothetical protein [Spirochaetota bacterium]